MWRKKKSKKRVDLQKISISGAAKQIKSKILGKLQHIFNNIKQHKIAVKDFGKNIRDGISGSLESVTKIRNNINKFNFSRGLKLLFIRPKKDVLAELPQTEIKEKEHKKHRANFVAIFSGKGGVGKTTTAVNLGLALKNFGKKVIVVDANLETPNLSLHLEIPPTPTNLHYVLNNNKEISDAIYKHGSGLSIVPAGISMEESANFNAGNLKNAISPLREQFDWVLIDCPPGLWGNVSEIIGAADEVLIVTNPELPALIDALKAIKTAKSLKVNIKGVILNKVTGSKYDTNNKTVNNILNEPIISKIPYDENVRKSIAKREPLISYKPNSPASRNFKALAARLEGKKYKESTFEKLLSFTGL